MNLMTKALRKAIPAIRSQEEVADPLVVAKFFLGSATWLAIEFDGKDEFFGAVDLGMTEEPELGSFSLSELESVRLGGLAVERDLYFKPTPLSEFVPSIKRG